MSSAVGEDFGALQLELARAEESSLLANLLELYIHDLSEAFDVRIGADGRFGYPRLSSYWSEPGTRFPFLIRKSARVLGFVLAQRGSPLTDDAEIFDVAEFFVLRGERRSGVGARAAALLWEQLPGRWSVRVSEANRGGLPFWERVVEDYAGDAVTRTQRDSAAHRWQVFTFDTRARASRGR
jgi:predicted acetyltransferase